MRGRGAGPERRDEGFEGVGRWVLLAGGGFRRRGVVVRLVRPGRGIVRGVRGLRHGIITNSVKLSAQA